MDEIEIAEEEIEIVEELEDIESEKYLKEKRTVPVMSIYEKIKILNMRVIQLNSNFKTSIPELVDEKNLSKSLDIAVLEFDTGNLPEYYLKRKFPNGDYELWKHEDFDFFPQ